MTNAAGAGNASHCGAVEVFVRCHFRRQHQPAARPAEPPFREDEIGFDH